jgi:hypothetical protein
MSVERGVCMSAERGVCMSVERGVCMSVERGVSDLQGGALPLVRRLPLRPGDLTDTQTDMTS